MATFTIATEGELGLSPKLSVTVSGPALDPGTIAQLDSLGQEVRYIDVQTWDELDGAWAHVLGGPELLDADAIDRLPNSVKLICFLGTGYQSYVDAKGLSQRGITGCYTPHANAFATAEFSVGLLLMGMRRMAAGITQVQNGEWDPPQGNSIRNASVGVVGFGHVGREVVRILHGGFNIAPLVWNRTNRNAEIESAGGRPAELDDLFRECSAVLVHANVVGDEAPLIGDDLLSTVREQFVLVNTSRGSTIDPAAVKRALQSRKEMTIASDVYFKEPVSEESDEWGLLSNPQFILTPHMAYSSDDSVRQMGAMVVANIGAFLAEEDVPHPMS